MRLLLILMLLPVLLSAQPSETYPIRYHFCGTYGIPAKNSAKGKNNTFIAGQVVEGGGSGVSFTYPIKNGWYVGVGVRFMNYKLSSDDISTQLYQQFNTAGYITNPTPVFKPYRLDMAYINAEFSKVFHVKFLEVEPFVFIGPAFWGVVGRTKIRQYDIQQKDVVFINMNDTIAQRKPTLYGAMGVRLNKTIFKKFFNVSFGCYYSTTGNMQYAFLPERVDFYSNKQRLQPIIVNSRFSNFQFDFSMHLRLWRRNQYKGEVEEN